MGDDMKTSANPDELRKPMDQPFVVMRFNPSWIVHDNTRCLLDWTQLQLR